MSLSASLREQYPFSLINLFSLLCSDSITQRYLNRRSSANSQSCFKKINQKKIPLKKNGIV